MKRALTLFALLAAACGSQEHHSAVLITLDTTRADALSCYGNPEPTTPVLDALAADGLRFEAAHTVLPLTLPAHASMLTGLTPLRHGLRDNGVAALPESAATIATRARAAGLDTAAFVSSVVLDDDFGLQHGFEVYSVPERKAAAERTHGAERPARATIDAALAWLRARDPERPFFLWVHLYDAHDPYTPPVDFAQRFSTPYLGEVAAADHELGRLFETLRSSGRFDETFIVALADHGEAFGEHGEVTHGTFCYETTLHIPLLARWPKSSPARRTGVSSELVSAVDIAPTLLEALALPPLDGVDGLSFYSRALPAERGIYFESYYGYLSCGWSPLTGWLDARGKYIHSSEPEFYDWRADPRELTDLASARAGALAPYRDSIARLADAPALASAAVNGDAETLARIQALGYASSGESDGELPHPLAPNTLASPRSQASFFLKQARAKERLAQRDPAGAAEIYREVLRESPNNFFALEELGTLATELGKTDEAIPLLTRLAHEGPQRGRYYHKLGLALMAAKRFEDALVPLLHAAELTGGRPRYLEALRDAYARLGRAEEMAAIEARFQEKN